MDLLIKTSQFLSSIEKLGDMKLLVQASKAQEKSAKVSEQARSLYNRYLKTTE
jgi:hypothetical protein